MLTATVLLVMSVLVAYLLAEAVLSTLDAWRGSGPRR